MSTNCEHETLKLRKLIWTMVMRSGGQVRLSPLIDIDPLTEDWDLTTARDPVTHEYVVTGIRKPKAIAA